MPAAAVEEPALPDDLIVSGLVYDVAIGANEIVVPAATLGLGREPGS